MQTIQNTVRRLFAMATLLTIKAAVLRACGKLAVAQAIRPTEPVSQVITERAADDTDDDTEERFAAWEAERDERLHEAKEYEEQGLRLLNRAALLRAAQRCDDRGETFIAAEL